VTWSKNFSVWLLVVLGFIVVAAGTVDLLKETGLLSLSVNFFGPILIVAVGLSITACAVECKGIYDKQ
jgi:hypothetical protein